MVVLRKFPDSELVFELARFLPCREGQRASIFRRGRALCYEAVASREGFPCAEAEDICRVATVRDTDIDGADGVHGLQNLPFEIVDSRLIGRHVGVEIVDSRLIVVMISFTVLVKSIATLLIRYNHLLFLTCSFMSIEKSRITAILRVLSLLFMCSLS